MNEVDSWLLLLLYVLYEIQNQIFQHTFALADLQTYNAAAELHCVQL